MATETHSFLGANTPNGFVSLFGELYDPYRDHNVYIIKGGPGCGKSTLMKRIAKRATALGCDVECVHCSSDPDSLDAVLVPSLRLFVCDGTAPHVVEPRFPGACENIINLGAFWDAQALRAQADRIRQHTLETALCHRRSTRYLAAAGALRQASLQLLQPLVLEEKLNGYALRWCMRLLPNKKSRPGKATRRFLSGITPQGVVFYPETVRAAATEITLLDDPFSPAAGMLLQRMAARASAHGYDHTVLLDPLDPHGDPLGLLIPQQRLALLRKTAQTAVLPAARTLHANRFLQPDAVRRHRQRLQFQQKTAQSLIDESVRQLQQAKETHDLLERCYTKAIDFDALNRATDRLLDRLFGEELSKGG
jgi:hypothetical protein